MQVKPSDPWLCDSAAQNKDLNGVYRCVAVNIQLIFNGRESYTQKKQSKYEVQVYNPGIRTKNLK